MWISLFINSKYKACYQPWKVFILADDPSAEDAGCAFPCRQRKSQFINLAETVVPAMRGIFGSGSSLAKGLAQSPCVGKRNAQCGLEDPRLVPSIPMEQIEGIILQFRGKVRSFTIGKLHTLNLGATGGCKQARLRTLPFRACLPKGLSLFSTADE
jgi:hypothetical protein